LLVGEPGSGKTWAFRQLAATLADELLQGDTLTPQPIYIPLHTLDRGTDITDIWNAVPEAQGALQKFRDGTNTVLLLDGIDEMTLHSPAIAVRAITAIVKSAPSNAGIAISSRPQLASEILQRSEELGRDLVACRILQSDTNVIDDYFRAAGLEMPANIGAVLDIRQPALLRMLHQEILSVWTSGSITIMGLYQAFVSASIQSAQKRDRRVDEVPSTVLWSFLTKLAAKMFPHVTVNINDVQIDDEWDSKRLDIINALVAAGLLVLDSRERISFVHASFFEFFFAKLIFEEFLFWNAKHLARTDLIYSYNVNRFLVPMLLNAPGRELSERAQDTRQLLQQSSVSIGSSFLSKPILKTQFVEFLDDTGWRRHTGFGQWVMFTDSAGKHRASDGTILPEREHISTDKRASTIDTVATSLSWYDAFQFARWVGGSLPDDIPPGPLPETASPELEWTSTWFSESDGLIIVRDSNERKSHGVNPDVRSSKIGFRVKF